MKLQMIPHYIDHTQLIMGSFYEPLTKREKLQLQELVDYLGWTAPTIILFGIDGNPRDWSFTLKGDIRVSVLQRPRRCLRKTAQELLQMQSFAGVMEAARDALSCGLTPQETLEHLKENGLFLFMFRQKGFSEELLKMLEMLWRENE